MNSKTWNLTNLYEVFIQLEEDMNIFNLKVQDMILWERIRFKVFKELFLKKAIHAQDEDDVSYSFIEKRKLKNYYLKSKNFLRAIFQLNRNPFLTKKKDILFISSPRRKLKQNGKWWDIYTDYFVEELGHSYVSMEDDFKLQIFTPPQTKNLRYFTFLEILVLLKRILGLSKITLTNGELNSLKRLEDTFYQKFEVKINFTQLAKEYLARRKMIIPLYKRVLKRVQPKLVILVCSYGKENFIEACKQNKIPVVELQHGVITKYHTGYSYEKETAEKILFPDFLFTFGEFWKETINYPIEKEKIISVGYPELENQKEAVKNIPKKKQILIISQPGSGVSLSEFVVKLSKEKDLNYNIVYKLHPGESATWRADYPWLIGTNIEVIDYGTKDLYELFAESEVQIGVNSTALFEGMSFGLKTFILDLPGIEYIQPLIDKKIITIISNPQEIMKVIDSQSNETFETERFFKRNATKNIIDEIDRLISKT